MKIRKYFHSFTLFGIKFFNYTLFGIYSIFFSFLIWLQKIILTRLTNYKILCNGLIQCTNQIEKECLSQFKQLEKP